MVGKELYQVQLSNSLQIWKTKVVVVVVVMTMMMMMMMMM
jgi:hypothetical protein